jgi:hypothetical protein
VILTDPNNLAARPGPPVHVRPKDRGRPPSLQLPPRHTRNALTPAILEQVKHAGLKDSAGNLALLARLAQPEIAALKHRVRAMAILNRSWM